MKLCEKFRQLLWPEAIMQYNENMPVDLQVFDMTCRGYPAYSPAMSFQIRPTASWFTLFSIFVMLQNCPMPQSQTSAIVLCSVQQHFTFPCTSVCLSRCSFLSNEFIRRGLTAWSLAFPIFVKVVSDGQSRQCSSSACHMTKIRL